jgi:hypothetical protein
MSTRHVDLIARSVDQTHLWINDVADGATPLGTEIRQLVATGG